MIGSLHPDTKDVTVVGAGISGLLSAYYLDRAGYTVRLIEGSDTVGGLIGTVSTPYGIAERAANSILVSEAVQDLCTDLKIPLRGVQENARSRYIWRKRRCRRMPLSLFELAGVLRRVLFRKGLPPDDSRTFEEWGSHHLGYAGVKYLLTPFLLGIYGARPSEISVSAAFPFLNAGEDETLYGVMKRRKRERVRAGGEAPVMQAPRDGMSTLIDALEKHLKKRLGDRFEVGKPVARLPESGAFWLSTPAPVTADLIEGLDSEGAAALRSVAYAPMISVTVFVTLRELSRFDPGVGVLIPPSEGRRCLGVLFPSSSSTHRVTEGRFASFTMMMGGTIEPDILNQDDAAIRTRVVEELVELFGYSGDPLHMEIFRWPRAIPLYSPELMDTWKTLQRGWCSQPDRVVMGNYTGEVSIRGMIETLDEAFPKPY